MFFKNPRRSPCTASKALCFSFDQVGDGVDEASGEPLTNVHQARPKLYSSGKLLYLVSIINTLYNKAVGAASQ